MNVSEIIEKTELTQEEMEFVVEEYVWEKKNKRVKINIQSNPILQLIPKAFAESILRQELNLLNHAYNCACEYFFEKLK